MRLKIRTPTKGLFSYSVPYKTSLLISIPEVAVYKTSLFFGGSKNIRPPAKGLFPDLALYKTSLLISIPEVVGYKTSGDFVQGLITSLPCNISLKYRLDLLFIFLKAITSKKPCFT